MEKTIVKMIQMFLRYENMNFLNNICCKKKSVFKFYSEWKKYIFIEIVYRKEKKEKKILSEKNLQFVKH